MAPTDLGQRLNSLEGPQAPAFSSLPWGLQVRNTPSPSAGGGGGCPFLRPPLHHSLPQDAPRPVGIPHLFPQPPIDLAVGEGLFPVGLPRAVPTTSGTGPGA